MTKANKVAVEIANVLRYNPELSFDDRVRAIESRLVSLINDIEEGAKKAHERAKENVVPVSDYTEVLPIELLNRAIKNTRQLN